MSVLEYYNSFSQSRTLLNDEYESPDVNNVLNSYFIYFKPSLAYIDTIPNKEWDKRKVNYLVAFTLTISSSAI